MKRLPLWSAVFSSPAVAFGKEAIFDPVKPGQPLSFPGDHGAHLKHRTEWWYVTGFLTPAKGSGESLGFQVTFFRSATGEGLGNPSRFTAKQLLFSHAALALKSEGKLMHEQGAIRVGFDRLTTLSEQDTDLRALRWKLKRESGTPEASVYSVLVEAQTFSLDLKLVALTPPALQGVMGFSQKGPSVAQASHYYSRPQLQVQGRVLIGAQRNPASQIARTPKEENYVGRAWMDHEWSNEVLDESAAGWDWVGLNFDDGTSLMAFQIRPRAIGPAIWSEARGLTKNGQADFVIDAQALAPARRQALAFKPKRLWRSLRSNALYPVELEIELQRPDSGVKRMLSLQPLMDDQEIDARKSTGGFYWEGLVYVFENQRRVGQGYLELTGYASPMKL